MSRQPSTQMVLQVGGVGAAPALSCAKPLLGSLSANVRWGPDRVYGNGMVYPRPGDVQQAAANRREHGLA